MYVERVPPLVHPRIVLARLRSELKKPPGEGRIRRADVHALVVYVGRCLRVMPYVRHAPGCRQAIRQGQTVRCTCGLAAAWSGEDDLPEELTEVPSALVSPRARR